MKRRVLVAYPIFPPFRQRGFRRVSGRQVPPNCVAYFHYLFHRDKADDIVNMSGGKTKVAAIISAREKEVRAAIKKEASRSCRREGAREVLIGNLEQCSEISPPQQSKQVSSTIHPHLLPYSDIPFIQTGFGLAQVNDTQRLYDEALLREIEQHVQRLSELSRRAIIPSATDLTMRMMVAAGGRLSIQFPHGSEALLPISSAVYGLSSGSLLPLSRYTIHQTNPPGQTNAQQSIFMCRELSESSPLVALPSEHQVCETNQMYSRQHRSTSQNQITDTVPDHALHSQGSGTNDDDMLRRMYHLEHARELIRLQHIHKQQRGVSNCAPFK